MAAPNPTDEGSPGQPGAASGGRPRTNVNDDDFEARQAGEDVGLQAWSKAKTYFNGKAIPKA